MKKATKPKDYKEDDNKIGVITSLLKLYDGLYRWQDATSIQLMIPRKYLIYFVKYFNMDHGVETINVDFSKTHFKLYVKKSKIDLFLKRFKAVTKMLKDKDKI